MESALITSPSRSSASETARSDFPEPVGPTTAITGVVPSGVCVAPSGVTAIRLAAADRQAWHAQGHPGPARGGTGGGNPAGIGLGAVPGVAGPGASEAVVG